MSAPLVVNTTDGTVWTRRAVTRKGDALYALAAVEDCPETVMATLAELAEHGIAGTADALPVPVGPEASRSIAYARKITDADLLLAHPSEKQRAAEWPWDMWCRICHIRPTSHRTEAEALEAADQHVKLYHAPQDEVHKLMTAGGLAEFERLRARVAELEAALRQARADLTDSHDDLEHALGRDGSGLEWSDLISIAASGVRAEARVAELEAERHSTNEALDDAAQELRERRECAFKNPHEPHTNEPGRPDEWQCPGVPGPAETGGA